MRRRWSFLGWTALVGVVFGGLWLVGPSEGTCPLIVLDPPCDPNARLAELRGSLILWTVLIWGAGMLVIAAIAVGRSRRS